MYLSNIKIHGFKSFRSKACFSFSPNDPTCAGITAIVGPNGSGKSNVADAIRWVLGEQSVKLLRGKKSEDVIFAGSESKSRLGMAEVVITINNQDGTFPVEYQEVTIGRRLYRDSGSEYYLNGSKVRLQDLQLLLARAGIGGRTYAVIGQGMIDHVLTSSPAERKDFFDEAAGVKEFEIKKRQAELKLKSSRENLVHAQTVIEELTPRVRSLSRQVKRLEEREKVEEELSSLQEQYYGSQWSMLSREIERIREKESGVNEKLEKARVARDEHLSKLNSLEEESTVSEELLNLQKQYEDKRKEREEIYELLVRSETDLEIMKARLEVDQGDNPVSLSRVMRLLGNLSDAFSSLYKAVSSCKSIKDLSAIKKDFSVYKEKLEEHYNQFSPKKKVVKSKGEKKLHDRINELKEDVEKKERDLGVIKEKMGNVSKEESQKKSEFFCVQRELQNSAQILHSIEDGYNSLRIERAKIETRVSALESEMRYELEGRMEEIKGWSGSDAGMDTDEMHLKLVKLKSRLEMIGGIDPESVSEYGEVKERYDFLVEQVSDLLSAIEALESGIEELNLEMKRRRADIIGKIDKEFARYFKLLFMGGKAGLLPLYGEVQDIDSDEQIKSKVRELSGIDIKAQPPGKRIKDITMLSGGERALTSVALICAILTVSPSPFVVLDEVDAALDESNSVRFSEILEKLSERTQFIVVTHNRATMQKSRVLYGITMGDDGVSQVLSVELERATVWAK